MRTTFQVAAAVVAFGALSQAAPAPVAQGGWPTNPSPSATAASAATAPTSIGASVQTLPASGAPLDGTATTSAAGTGAAATAATSAGTSPSGLPASTGNSSTGGSAAAPGQPKQYDCSFAKSGQPSAFPDESTWLSGEQLWALHLEGTKAANKDTFPDESSMQEGLAAMKDALISFPWTLGVPELQGVPDGLFVAKAVQESTIRANPPCTNAGTTNCGILQGPQGSRLFEKANVAQSLKNVVEDAIKGKNDSGGGYGDGFVAGMKKATEQLGATSPKEVIAIATRLYNSGLNSLRKRLNLNTGTAASTPSYVSDMANLLTGWVNDGQHGSYATCGASA